jgi:hypothetical protein
MSESKETKSISPANSADKVGVISMHDFLQFLKISCQVCNFSIIVFEEVFKFKSWLKLQLQSQNFQNI